MLLTTSVFRDARVGWTTLRARIRAGKTPKKIRVHPCESAVAFDFVFSRPAPVGWTTLRGRIRAGKPPKKIRVHPCESAVAFDFVLSRPARVGWTTLRARIRVGKTPKKIRVHPCKSAAAFDFVLSVTKAQTPCRLVTASSGVRGVSCRRKSHRMRLNSSGTSS